MTMIIDGGGTITGLVPGGLPDASVQQADLANPVAGNGPAFSAYQSSAQAVTTGNNKVLYQTEEFDTNNNFASSRFTPTVAGYYYLNGTAYGTWTNQEVAIYLYKNGSNFKVGNDQLIPTGGLNYMTSVNALVYANGTTDYFEIYIYSGSNQNLSAFSTNTYFSGCLIRAA